MGGLKRVHWGSRPSLPRDLHTHRAAVSVQRATRPQGPTRRLTEQLDLEPDLGQRLDKDLSLGRGNVAAVAAEHVEAVRPVRPARLVGRDLVRERAAARAEQREGERGRELRRAGAERQVRLVVQVWERRACACRYLGDVRDVDRLGQVFKPFADRELDSAVDVVQRLQTDVLIVCIEVRNAQRVIMICVPVEETSMVEWGASWYLLGHWFEAECRS